MNKIAVIGTGYVGLVTGLVFAKLGHYVHFIDLDEEKVSKLQNQVLPFYEPGLKDIFMDKEVIDRVSYSSEYSENLKEVEIVFICVQTPQEDGRVINPSFLYDALISVKESIGESTVICIKSTFPPTLLDDLEMMNLDVGNVIFNPEFLREGSAIFDFNNPDRILIGGSNEESLEFLENLYKDFDSEIIITDSVTALLIKYLSNAYLSMRLSFVNEALQIGDSLGADIPTLLDGIGADKRIGKDYFRPSPGWGGSCFPKDTKALEIILSEKELNSPLLNVINLSNREHIEWISEKTIDLSTSNSKTNIILYGAAFKENTDDMRDSPTVELHKILKSKGKKVSIFDEFNTGLANAITDINEINNSLVVLMYPIEDMMSIIENLQRNENTIYVPWKNKTL